MKKEGDSWLIIKCLFASNFLTELCSTPATIANSLGEFNFDIPPSATIKMLDNCLSDFFQFGNCFYEQVKGSPMDS